MKSESLPAKTILQIEKMVQLYVERREEFVNLAQRVERDLVENAGLRPLIHSAKRREKDPSHLADKLKRKAIEAKKSGNAFSITESNLFKRVGDLAGVRLLHLHTQQLSDIHPKIIEIFNFHKYKLRERPLAFSWDVERKVFLEMLGLKVEIRPKMYTSVHYVVEPHWGHLACEVQVRTLAEELWGEVSHTIDYPHETSSVACREQLAALARVASGCTRLVDSIFASRAEYNDRNRRGRRQ
jgi:putative GTP pyrophosphokinase